MTTETKPSGSPSSAATRFPPMLLVEKVLAALLQWAPALRSRNYRLFWIGQVISVIGTSIQVLAEGWLIYEITNSTFWLGMVGLLGLLPVVPISFLGGVLIDRVPRRKLIMATQIGLLLQATVFATLAMSGNIRLWHIIALYFVFGSLLAIDHPARRAFLVELVDEDDLANAVALNATVFNMSSLIGYALAGLLIASIDVGTTMLLNAMTYIAPIIALGMIHVSDIGADRGAPTKLKVALWEGISTLWRQPAILGVITLMAVVGGLAFPVFGLMPAFAEEVVQTDAVGLGILMASGALGSILGTASLARLGNHQRGRTLMLSSIVLPILVTVFAFTTQLWLASLLLITIGMALLIVQSLTITLVQIHIPDRVRGRVMSIYSQLHAGSDTMGNVLIGGIAVYIGLPVALAVGSAIALLYAVGLRIGMPAVQRFD